MPGRLAVRILQAGSVAVVLAATIHRAFDLDRFLVTKELVLHATAALAALAALGAMRAMDRRKADVFLVAYLALSAASAVFATNPWMAARALAISISSVLLFWTARAVPERQRAIVNGLALAVILSAVTALLQAYGVWIDLFSHNRAPGGTLGNRNFVAHAAAFGMPLVLLSAFRGNVLSFVGIPVVAAALVLTRSRAAWLAFAAAMAMVLLSLAFARGLRTDRRLWLKVLLVIALIGGGAVAALLLPNALRWRSDNPYLESVQGVVNYQEGSGRGRLIQYGRSLAMAARHPLFGVGPGNWGVEYPDHAPASDPSIDRSEGGMTFNPWPSSDWVAFASERGFAAAIVLAIAFALIALRAPFAVDPLAAMALLGTMAGAVVAGLFDAVLMLALPSFIVWTAMGTLSSARVRVPVPVEPEAETPPPPNRRRALAAFALAILALAAALRSAGQLVAMELYTRGGRESLQRAAELDPGNYRVRLRLARGGKGRCEHALAARALYPHAAAARAAAKGCD